MKMLLCSSGKYFDYTYKINNSEMGFPLKMGFPIKMSCSLKMGLPLKMGFAVYGKKIRLSNFEIFLYFVDIISFYIQINILIKSTFLEKRLQSVQGARFFYIRKPKKDSVIFLRLKAWILQGITISQDGSN